MKKRDPFEIANQGVHYLTGKLVGGYISQQAAAYLRLLAVYKGGTIQSVLQEMIEDWMNEQEPEVSIMETLVDRIYMEWIRRMSGEKTSLAETNWRKYEAEVIERLRRRKISDEMILKIVKEMRRRVGKV